MYKMTKKYIVLLFVLWLNVDVAAQPQSGGGNSNPTPIGFTEVLLLGGAVVGAQKIRNRKKQNDANLS